MARSGRTRYSDVYFVCERYRSTVAAVYNPKCTVGRRLELWVIQFFGGGILAQVVQFPPYLGKPLFIGSRDEVVTSLFSLCPESR